MKEQSAETSREARMDWSKIPLHGAGNISRVCGIYEVIDTRRVPDGKYKIKVLQRPNGTFAAVPNICVRSEAGVPEWIGGLGNSELEALDDALKSLGAELDLLQGSLERERFEWSDPTEF